MRVTSYFTCIDHTCITKYCFKNSKLSNRLIPTDCEPASLETEIISSGHYGRHSEIVRAKMFSANLQDNSPIILIIHCIACENAM